MSQLKYLKLIPPTLNNTPVYSTNQLFTVLGDLAGDSPLSFEIMSTYSTGISFIVGFESHLRASIEQAIRSYLPGTNIEPTVDYMSSVELGNTSLVYYAQNKHYAYPLKRIDEIDEVDPMTYLTGAMTKLDPSELISFQLVVSGHVPKDIEKIHHAVLRSEHVDNLLSSSGSSKSTRILSGLSKASLKLTDLVTLAYHGDTKQYLNSSLKDAGENKKIQNESMPSRRISSFEEERIRSIEQKILEPLFLVSVRALVVSSDEEIRHNRLGRITAALKSYTSRHYQTLQVIDKSGSKILSDFKLRTLSKPMILSVNELSNFYHFPNYSSGTAENVDTVLSKLLPAPLSLKQNRNIDLYLGENHYQGVTTPIGLTAEEREKHIYILGGTGNGKTTTLEYAILQDIKSGKGLAVIDPHGDLAESILSRIPEYRIKDVIYLNPDDLERPIGINLLEIDRTLTGDDLLREKDLITESVISVMRKIFSSDDSGGHRVEYILRNCIQTALTIEGATLFTIFDLLNDSKYRRKVVKALEDDNLKNFWNNAIGKAGSFQKVKMSAGITSKIGRFLFSASAKRILEQEKSTIDFMEIINEGKILVCNFSKGLLGEDTSTLFGTAILSKLQVASLRRARINQKDRRPFYLYVDEFQNFATTSFVQMLSEARKYKLYLTMAEQSTSQQDQKRLVDIILANVGTIICFRTGSPADEDFILPLFKPFISRGDISNLSAYTFYAKLASLDAQEPMSGETLLLSDKEREDVRLRVISSSRSIYGNEYIEPPVNIKPQEVPKNNNASKTNRKKSLSHAGKR